MSIRSTLTHRLRETWHGAPWFGDSGDKILADIAAEEASRRVVDGAHSIWEIVLHMTAWAEAAAARVRGAGAKAPERGDWPPVNAASADDWKAAIAGLASAHRELVEEIEATHEEDIQIHVKNHSPPFADTGISRAGTVAGLIEHDAYHLGQIALLKKALRSKR